MYIEDKEIRTTKGNKLLGYRAVLNGERGIALINGKKKQEVLGFISPGDLLKQVKSGHCIDLDDMCI